MRYKPVLQTAEAATAGSRGTSADAASRRPSNAVDTNMLAQSADSWRMVSTAVQKARRENPDLKRAAHTSVFSNLSYTPVDSRANSADSQCACKLSTVQNAVQPRPCVKSHPASLAWNPHGRGCMAACKRVHALIWQVTQLQAISEYRGESRTGDRQRIYAGMQTCRR